jgi:AcrR family transcriptional regulator
MPKSRSSRPANRPSRRHEILEAAVDLLAVQPPDEIAVSDIAAHCGMTPAAFYYHFASKDEILDEIVAGFAEQWSETVQAALAEVHSQDDLPQCVDQVLNWVEEHERSARVFFVTSVGATSSAEAVRRRTRNELARRAARTFREIAPAQDRIRVAIAGLGMVTLLEVVARSRLDLDASYRTLGPVRFRATAGELAEALIQ